MVEVDLLDLEEAAAEAGLVGAELALVWPCDGAAVDGGTEDGEGAARLGGMIVL